MGRWTTGAKSTKSAKRIELSYFVKKGLIKEGVHYSTTFSWKDNHGRNSGNILLIFNYKEDQPYFNLIYTITNKQTGEERDFNYKIYLASVPSNLGKGKVWYFRCPVSGKRCRILYMVYYSDYFKAREAYQHRIYYSCQMASKYDYANSRYWTIKKQIEDLRAEKYFKWWYKGEQTKRAKLYNRLWEELSYWDQERWSLNNLPKSLRDSLQNTHR